MVPQVGMVTVTWPL